MQFFLMESQMTPKRRAGRGGLRQALVWHSVVANRKKKVHYDVERSVIRKSGANSEPSRRFLV
jgi:hypothetical protein